jgi:hypothetical protein
MNKRNWLKLMIVAAIACTTAVYAAGPAPVKGNPDSKVYHKAACRHYTAKSSTKEFKSEPDVKAGYKPCKQCAAPKAQTKTGK